MHWTDMVGLGLMVGLLTLAVGTWGRILTRLWQRKAILPPSGRRRLTWSLPEVLLGFGCWIAGGLAGHAAIRAFAAPRVPVEAGVDRQVSGIDLLVHGMAELIAAICLIAFLQARGHLRWKPAHAGGSRWRYNVSLGLAGFAALAVPVLGLQYLLSEIWQESSHRIIQVFDRSLDLPTILGALLLAVIAAPLMEELLFRVLLQGWLERVAAGADTTVILPATSDHPESRTARPWWPVLVTSLVFAVCHAGNGPDPIPLFFFAFGLGSLYRQTRRVVPCVAMHAALNLFSVTLLWLARMRG